MTTPLFIWLGAGRARRHHVGPPAARLDQAANAGLPVPAGAVLLDAFFRVALANGLAQANGGVVIPDVELWHNTLHQSAHLPRFRRPVDIYAIAADESPVGLPAPLGRTVEFNDPHAAARAVERVWSAGLPATEPPRRDVLIVETVAATVAGTATTIAGQPADRITLHHSPDSTFDLPQLSSRHRPDSDQPPYSRRLQQLLRGARRTFGPGAWQIAWADDGHICWLTLAAPAVPELAG